TRVVLRKVAVHFDCDIVFCTGQPGSLYMKTTAFRSHTKNSRRLSFFFTLPTKNHFDCIDAFRRTQESLDVAATKQQRSSSFHLVLRRDGQCYRPALLPSGRRRV